MLGEGLVRDTQVGTFLEPVFGRDFAGEDVVDDFEDGQIFAVFFKFEKAGLRTQLPTFVEQEKGDGDSQEMDRAVFTFADC
jgi:hypothetical protein